MHYFGLKWIRPSFLVISASKNSIILPNNRYHISKPYLLVGATNFTHKSEQTLCARGKYSKLLIVISSNMCNQIVRKVIFSEEMSLHKISMHVYNCWLSITFLQCLIHIVLYILTLRKVSEYGIIRFFQFQTVEWLHEYFIFSIYMTF